MVKRPREEVTHIGRGDILLVNFAPAQPGEADHTRPAIVITNDVANEHSPAIVVIPVTSNVERVYPFELLLPASREVLRGYLEYAASAPDDLTTIANLMHALDEFPAP